MNPKTGKVERYWGGGTFTQGEDPTGGMGPGWQGDGSQVAQQAIQQATPQAGQPASGAGDLWSQYQPELTSRTQQSNQAYQDYNAMSAQLPTFSQKLLDAIKQAELYPSHAAMRAEYMKNPNLTSSAIEGLVARRGQGTRGTIQDIINRAYGGVQADVAQRQGAAQQAQQSRSNLLEEYGLAYQSQQDAMDRLKKTGGSKKADTTDEIGGTTPQYTPARAGITDTGPTGQSFISDDRGGWSQEGWISASFKNVPQPYKNEVIKIMNGGTVSPDFQGDPDVLDGYIRVVSEGGMFPPGEVETAPAPASQEQPEEERMDIGKKIREILEDRISYFRK